MKKYLPILGMVLLSTLQMQTAKACSRYFIPEVRANPNEYLFEGIVVGFVEHEYLKALDPWERRRTGKYDQAAAVLVRPTRMVNAPSGRRDHAVFLSQLQANCDYELQSMDHVKSRFRIGEAVSVIGFKSSLTSSPNRTGAPEYISDANGGWIQKSHVSYHEWPKDGSSAFYQRLKERRRSLSSLVSHNSRIDGSVEARKRERLNFWRNEYEFKRDLHYLSKPNRRYSEINKKLFKIANYYSLETCQLSDLVYNHMRYASERRKLALRLLANGHAPLTPNYLCSKMEEKWDDDFRL